METLLQDVRYAARTLARSPGFTAVAVLTLALGIGANAATFGIVDTLLLRAPDQVREPDRLVRVYWANTWRVLGHVIQAGGSYPTFEAIRDHARTLAGAAAEWPRDIAVGRGRDARRVPGALVSHEYFPLLGVAAERGRLFVADDDRPGAAGVAVISDDLWRSSFAADTAVLGRTLRVGSQTYTIVGVAPRGFRGATLQPEQLWLPMAAAATELVFPDALTNAGNRWLHVIGRVRGDARPERAAAELSALFRSVEAQDSATADSTAHVVLGPIQESRAPTTRARVQLPLLFAGMSLIVLLVGVANVANLLLARALGRRREIAVRLAVGAARWRLMQQLLTESVLLALLGGTAAVLVATWGAPVLRAFLLPADVAARAPVDLRVLGFTGVVTMLVGIAAGLAPWWQSLHVDFLSGLKEGAREGGPAKSRLRSALLVGQAALTVMLLVGAGLFVRSLRNALAIDLGMETSRLITVEADLAPAGYAESATDATFRRMLERVQALPGVAHAALSVGGPFGWSYGRGIQLPGHDTLPHLSSGGPYYNAVSADFFAAMGTAIVRGRGFAPTDRAGAPPVAVVGETMARLFWPGTDPVGQCFLRRNSPVCYQVVGVARDAKRNTVLEAPQLQWYVPLEQDADPPNHRVLWVRAAGDATALLPLVQHTVQEVDADLPFVRVERVQATIDGQYRVPRLGATAFTVFGFLALVLAAVGLYGVLAYAVSRRAHEMGVRLALGATAGNVTRLVVADGLRVAAAGVAIGALGALVAGRLVGALLYGVQPADPLVLVTAAALVLVSALGATLVPARRAARVDPIIALRSE